MNKSITFIRKKGTVILSQTRNMKITTWLGAGFVLGMGIGVLNASFAIINYQDKTAGKEVIKALINESEIAIKNHNTHLHALTKDAYDKDQETRNTQYNNLKELFEGPLDENIGIINKNIIGLYNNINLLQEEINAKIEGIKPQLLEETHNIKEELNKEFTKAREDWIKELNKHSEDLTTLFKELDEQLYADIEDIIKEQLTDKINDVNKKINWAYRILQTQMQINAKLTLKNINAVKHDKEGHAQWTKTKLQAIDTTLNKMLDYSLPKSILKTGFKWFWSSS